MIVVLSSEARLFHPGLHQADQWDSFARLRTGRMDVYAVTHAVLQACRAPDLPPESLDGCSAPELASLLRRDGQANTTSPPESFRQAAGAMSEFRLFLNTCFFAVIPKKLPEQSCQLPEQSCQLPELSCLALDLVKV